MENIFFNVTYIEKLYCRVQYIYSKQSTSNIQHIYCIYHVAKLKGNERKNRKNSNYLLAEFTCFSHGVIGCRRAGNHPAKLPDLLQIATVSQQVHCFYVLYLELPQKLQQWAVKHKQFPAHYPTV